MAKKICNNCKLLLDINNFSKDSSRKDRHQNRCKKCSQNYHKQYIKDNYETLSEKSKNYRQKNLEIINIKRKLYRKQNKTLISQSNKKYQIKNPEYNKQYYINNLEKEKLRNKIYKTNNAAKINHRNSKRRCDKLKATPKWLTKEHLLQIENFYIEAKKLSKDTGIPHHVDHIIPLKGKNVCGLHVPWNLQILTASENCKKYNKIKA